MTFFGRLKENSDVLEMKCQNHLAIILVKIVQK